MSRPLDLAGQRYGRLTVISRTASSVHGKAQWTCLCDCGAETVAVAGQLVSGKTQSCGCQRRDAAARMGQANRGAVRTHGHARGKCSPTYRIWIGMLTRCDRPTARGYRYYGGRGITVCDRWRGPDGFARFLADMGERPEGMTIDRVDNDGHYEPGNCRWATQAEQNRNARTGRARNGRFVSTA
jgi:hypothetical protein